MKKQVLPLFAFLATVLFLVFSCNKKDDTPAKTKTQLITQSNWRFKNATINGSPYTSIPACQTDNIITFNTAGTGIIDEGATKCNSGDPQTTSFTWSLQSGETIVHMTTPLYPGTGNDFTLISISETELALQATYTPPIGPSFLVVITFQH